MENTPHRILVSVTSNSDAVITQQLEFIAQEYSVHIQIFHSASFIADENLDSVNRSSLTESNISNRKRQIKNSVSNLDLDERLATVLIQDSDFDINNSLPDSSSINLSFHEKYQRYQILRNLLQKQIIQNEIDSVVFLTTPKGLSDIILYQVSKTLEIDVLILCQSPVSDRFFSYSAIPDCGNYNKDIPISTELIQSNEEISIKRKKKHVPIKFQKSNASNFFKICKFLLNIRSIKLLNPLYALKHAKHLHNAPVNIAAWKDPFAKFFYCESTAYFEFLTNHHADKIDLNQKFVYFPLQPLSELHAQILDNQFGDQLVALEQLANFVPKDCKIFIKGGLDRDADYLTPMFFHRINRIHNVIRIPSCVASEQLIDGSTFIATVSSDEGWEALNKGKNVLVFGKPWYRKLPGAYEFCDEFEYVEVAESKIDHSDFLRQINCLFSQSNTGRLILNDEITTTDAKKNQNARCIVEAILELTLGRKKPTFQTESTG